MKPILFLLAFIFSTVTYGQLSGAYYIPGNFNSIANAINNINGFGIGAGGAYFYVAAGYTENASNLMLETSTATAANPIVFVKTGTGANPLITATSGNSTLDGIIKIRGTDYVTFDGIDLVDPSSHTTSTTRMEWGYAILMASSTDASQNITIVNCHITLQKAYTSSPYSSGIYSKNHTDLSTSLITPGAASGVVSNCCIDSCNISNVTYGINWTGSGTASYFGQNNYFGSVKGNTISNFGGGIASPYGIYTAYQNNLKIKHNTISGGTGTNATMYGIYGGTGANSNIEIDSNIISLSSTATTSTVYGIYSAMGSSGTNNLVRIHYNTISLNYPSATSGIMYGIYHNTSAWHCEISGNSIVNCIQGGGVNATASGSFYGINTSGSNINAGSFLNINGNIISGNSRVQSFRGAGNSYGIYNSSSGLTCSISDNQVFNNSWPSSGLTYGLYITNSNATNLSLLNNSVHDISKPGVLTNITPKSGILGGIYLAGSAVNGLCTVEENSVYNLTNTWGGPVYPFRCDGGNSSTVNIFSNQVHGITSNDAAIYGIFNGAGLNVKIYANKVYDMHAAVGDSGVFYGICTGSSTPSSTSVVYNNFISDLTAPESDISFSAGLYLMPTSLAGSVHRYYNNTVFLNQIPVSGNPKTASCYASTISTLDMRNNILVNTSPTLGTGATISFWRSSISGTTYSAYSNYNCFHAGTPGPNNLLFYAFDAVSPQSAQNLTGYQSIFPQEAQSFSEVPPFLNSTIKPYNLHLDSTNSTSCESGAGTINIPPISTDYDAQPRYPNPGYPDNTNPLFSSVAPDVGADEFGGIPSFNCVMPVPGNTLASANNLCYGEGTTLSLQYPPTGTGVTFQWQSSPDGLIFTNISGANDVNCYVVPNTSLYYRCSVTCHDGPVSATSAPLQLTFLNNVTGITPGTRCGTGTVTLEATGNPGTTVNWYSVPSGGYPIYTGNTFTTPVISATATYYAGTSGPTTSNSVGAPAIFVSYSFDTQTSTAEGINFNVLAGTVTIHTIDIYPTAPVGSPFTISVKQASATIASYSGTITVQGTLSEPAVQTVPVHFVLPSGTGYQITAPVNPGIIRNSGGDAFPYIVPGIISLTSSTLPSYYFNFYNWQITTACISPAFPVVATVLSPPSLSVSLGRTLCSGEVGQIKVTSTIPDFDTYTWSPVNHLYSDSACTIPYLSPVSATTVFFKSSLAGATTYTCSAQKVSSGCSNTAQTEIIVIPSPVITALPAAICVSGITTLGITPATGYGTATFQWQKSGDNILFSDIPGATSPAYTTETLNATQYYKILIMNEEGSICNEPSITISVNNPVIVSTTPGTRCGTGSVNLSATGSPGTSIKWYQGPSGGMSIGTGNSFATPVISASTSFYAAAGIAAGEVGSAGPAGNSMGVGGYAANDYYLLFDVIASSLHLNGLYVYPGASGNVKFYIADNTGTVLHTVTYPVQAGNIGMKTYIPVGFDIPTGMNYRIGYAASIGGVSLFRNTNGAGYPYSRTNIVTITGNSFPGNPQFYYYFYDWQVTAECWSGRTEVVATVTPAPAITVTATPNSVCAGGASNLNVTSSDAGYIYNWMPGNLNGGGQTVYQEVSTVYEVTANDPLTGCYTDGNVLVTVLPSPATLSISPPEPLVFQDSVQELTATGGDIDGFVILSESFDQPANNWIKTNNSTGGQPPNAAWTLRPDGYEYLSYGIWHSNDHSQFYLTNSNAQGSGSTTSTILQSPAFNTIGYSAANVSFDHYFYEPSAGSSTGVFEVSTDGTTWATLQTYSSTTGAVSAFARASIALTAEFLNQPSVYIRLKYDGAWRYFWGIDNIVIRGNAQTNVTWTPITSLYSDVNATLPYNGESTTTVYSKPSSTITYSVLATAVLTGCTRTDAVTVTVIQPCNAPTALTGNNITATAADLGWTETGTATQWNIEYGPSGFRQGTGTLISGVTLNPYHLIGLSESTAYDFHVRANCIQITSQWSVIQSFTTSAAIPLNLTVEGDISGSECYSALNTITVAENGPYNVQAGAQAEMIAGVSIIYKPGTRVWNNGYMLGRIAPNGPWCPVQPPAVMSAVTGVDIPVPGIESKSFAVYPNPTSGNFTLVQKGDHSPLLLKVEIFGMNGKSVLAETISGEKMHQFNLSELADGLYFIKVMGTDCFETIKLVKTRQVTK